MAKLKLMFNGDVLEEHRLEREELSIGRRPDNDIRIDNLAVSGRHARVVMLANDVLIEDLGSTNGTYVNGSAVHRHALRHGDLITLGKHEIRYEDTAEDAPAETPRTAVMASGSPQRTGARHGDSASETAGARAQSAPQAQAAPEARRRAGGARIRILSGSNAGKEMAIHKSLTTLGRPGTQVAAISQRPRGYYIVHVEGDAATPPTIDGEPIGSSACALHDNAIIEVAGVRMEFLLDSE